MPLIVQNDLPTVKALESEGLFTMTPDRAGTQDIRPLKIALVNLMPTRETTELQFMRLLSNTPLQVELTLMHMGSHKAKNVSAEYLQQFYKTLKQIEGMRFDGMIITGAPVENLDFNQVNYWDELKELLDYTKSNVFSTMHVCWGAQAGLFHHYGIPKYALPAKKFGVFPHTINPDNDLLLKGANDTVYCCHSRHTEWHRKDIQAKKALKIILDSNDAGVCMVSAHNARQIYISGHFEYDRETLAKEYFRDVDKGLPINIPNNYFKNDDPTCEPAVLWKSDANLLFSNWLNYIIYQRTPFNLEKLEPIE